MADDMEKNKQQGGQTGHQSGQPGQHGNQPGEQKKGGQGQNEEEDNETLDRQRRAS